MKTNIPVISYTNDPEEDPMWTSFYGNMLHPDYSHPCFFRHNGASLNLFNWYNGDTVYIIARGPSIGTYLENKEIRKMLMHPAIVKFGMNTSPEIVDNQVNLWAGLDKMRKFPASIFKNPNIMKFVPMNRFNIMSDGTKNINQDKAIAYMDGHPKYTCLCPNTVGVQTFLLEQHPKGQMSFGNAYLGSTGVLYGYYKGMKSVFLFTLKLCILLGFKRIVLLGVDFTMDKSTPYYQNTSSDYPKFHVDHNNKLYTVLTPLIKEIHGLLESGASGYKTKIVTAKTIESMPFIETVNLKEELKREIARKS
jgi:hypothetical protein